MERGYTLLPWCTPFETLLNSQLDHFWKKPAADKFSKDLSDWHVLPLDVKRRVKRVLTALNRMEPEIIDNVDDISSLMKKALPDIVPGMDPIFAMLAAQTTMEFEHRRSYALIDSILALPDREKGDYPFLEKKVDVISKWRKTSTDLKKALSTAILGNVLSEGLVFNTLFSFFFYLKKDGLLPTTCVTNEEVLTDENLHTSFFITMYRIFTERGYIPRLSSQEVHEMIENFVSVDDMAADEILGNMSVRGKAFFLVMTPENSKKYTRIVANSILDALGYDRLYKVSASDNPYSFVDQSLIHSLTSFFDKDSADYGLDIDHAYEEESDPED